MMGLWARQKGPKTSRRRAGAALAAAAAGLLWAAQAAPADELVLKDGTVYNGRTVRAGDDQVVFQVDMGGISATISVDRRDIDRLTESPPESAQLLEQYGQHLASAEQADSADAFVALGRWAQQNRLNDKALSAYRRALGRAPEQAASIGLLIAQCQAGANDLRAARATLRPLAEKFPGDHRIAALLAKLDQQAQSQIDQMVRLALEHYKKAEMRKAILLLERLQGPDMGDWQQMADQAARRLAGMSYARLLAQARLLETCPACGGQMQQGLVPCPTCKGTGSVTKTILETVNETDPKSGVQRRRTRQVDVQEICPTCRGFTSTVCQACNGAGVDLGSVGAVERGEVLAGLKKRIEVLSTKLAPYVDEPSSVHPVNLEAVHLAACRLRYYLQQYKQLDERIVGDELTTLAQRRSGAENLLRHTAAAMRSRNLESFKEALAERLRYLIQRDGILLPEDFQTEEPSKVSAGGSSSTTP